MNLPQKWIKNFWLRACNGKAWIIREVCPKLVTKTLEQILLIGIFIFNFKEKSHIVRVFKFLTLKELRNYNQKLFVSTTKIDENAASILKCHLTWQIYTLAPQTKYLHTEK